MFEIGHAADRVAHSEIGDVVVQRVDREVAAYRVFLKAAVDVIADQAAVDRMAVTAAIVAAAAKRRDFDDFATEYDVGKAKPAANQATIAKLRAYLLRRRVRRDVEILGVTAIRSTAAWSAITSTAALR